MKPFLSVADFDPSEAGTSCTLMELSALKVWGCNSSGFGDILELVECHMWCFLHTSLEHKVSHDGNPEFMGETAIHSSTEWCTVECVFCHTNWCFFVTLISSQLVMYAWDCEPNCTCHKSPLQEQDCGNVTPSCNVLLYSSVQNHDWCHWAALNI